MKNYLDSHWRTIAAFLLLLVASAIASGLIIVRRAFLGSWSHYFLIWNLFLAWIPLGVAFVLRLMQRPPLPFLLVGGVIWMAFLPNAPYLMTDLIHFQSSRSMPWLDWSLFLAFGLTGLFAGYASLVWMQAIVRERWGTSAGVMLTLLALAGCGIGVYIGRFLRWNSWDIATRPDLLASNLYNHFFGSETFITAWAMSAVFTALFAFCYAMVKLLATDDAVELVSQ